MLAFIAWTPLHVINILNTKMNFFPNDEADIFIYDEFSNSDKICDNIKSEKIFNNVYFVEHEKMGGKIESKLNVLFNRNIILPSAEPFKYEAIFTQGGNHFYKILYAKSKMNNSNLKLHYIEDGMVTYTSLDLMNVRKHRRILLNTINPYSSLKGNYINSYIYNPEFTNISQATKAHRLPKINRDNPIYNVLKRIFDYKEDKQNIKNSLVFFDQPTDHPLLKEVEKKAFSVLLKNSDNRRLFVKLHPRTDRNKYSKEIDILNTHLPWEVYCLLNNVENVTTVSLYSTASLNANIMFDISLDTVLLTRLLTEDEKYTSIINKDKALKNKLQELYRATSNFEKMKNSNIFLPKNEIEINKYLRKNTLE